MNNNSYKQDLQKEINNYNTYAATDKTSLIEYNIKYPNDELGWKSAIESSINWWFYNINKFTIELNNLP